MASIGSLNINLTARTRQFQKGLRTAEQRLNRFASNAVGASLKVAKFGAGLVALGGAAAALGVKRSLDSLDRLGKTADRIGISTEALAGLQRAAQLTGVETRTLNLGLQRFTRRVAEAASGTGEAQAAIKALGLDAKALLKLPLEERFKLVGERLNEVDSSAQRVQLAFKLFDSEGVGLVNTLKLGAKGLDEVAKQARELGLALNRTDVAKIEAANDAILTTGQAIRGVFNRLAVALSPVIQQVANWLTEQILAFKDLKRFGLDALESLARGADFARNEFRLFAAAVQDAVTIALKNALQLSVSLGQAKDPLNVKEVRKGATVIRDELGKVIDVIGDKEVDRFKALTTAIEGSEAAFKALAGSANSADFQKFFDKFRKDLERTKAEVKSFAAEPVPELLDLGTQRKTADKAKGFGTSTIGNFLQRKLETVNLDPVSVNAGQATVVKSPQLAQTNNILGEMLNVWRGNANAWERIGALS